MTLFEKKFDAIIIGSGSGMNIGAQAVNHGMKVAVCEHSLWGGTCLNNGCIPSKMIIYPMDVVRWAEEAAGLGVRMDVEELDFSAIMKRARDHVRGEREPMARAADHSRELTWYKETAEFTGDYTLKVGGDKMKSDMIFIASGTRPLIPKIPGADQVDLLTNENVFDLEKQPERMVIVGGGFVGCEFAHFFSSVGTEVTVLEMGDRLVAQEEPEVSKLLHEEMGKRMQVLTRHRLEGLEQHGETRKIVARDLSRDETIEMEADQILMAVGRISNADMLHPERTGVETDERGFIKVNEYLETTKDNIWAFGDALGVHMYRHAANYESEIAWNNAHLNLHKGGDHGHGHKVAVDFSAMPHAVYSHPQIASVGLTEKQAREQGKDILVGLWDYAESAKGEAMGRQPGFVKVVVEKENFKILGCHIIGYGAPIMVQEVVNVMNCPQGNALTILNSVHIHPALTEILQRAFASMG
jgi:mycothione reductase